MVVGFGHLVVDLMISPRGVMKLYILAWLYYPGYLTHRRMYKINHFIYQSPSIYSSRIETFLFCFFSIPCCTSYMYSLNHIPTSFSSRFLFTAHLTGSPAPPPTLSFFPFMHAFRSPSPLPLVALYYLALNQFIHFPILSILLSSFVFPFGVLFPFLAYSSSFSFSPLSLCRSSYCLPSSPFISFRSATPVLRIFFTYPFFSVLSIFSLPPSSLIPSSSPLPSSPSLPFFSSALVVCFTGKFSSF